MNKGLNLSYTTVHVLLELKLINLLTTEFGPTMAPYMKNVAKRQLTLFGSSKKSKTSKWQISTEC